MHDDRISQIQNAAAERIPAAEGQDSLSSHCSGRSYSASLALFFARRMEDEHHQCHENEA